jgi:uncharacterized protein (TIGR03437 family)
MIKLYKYLGLIILAVFFFISCDDDANPGLDGLITPPTTPPSLTSIEPQNGGLAGITILTINGANFSSDLSKNEVYFNGVKGEILEGSSTQLKVKPPIVVSDSVQVKVSVFKVEDFSNILFYKLAPAAVEIFKFNPANDGTPYAITLDAQENVYASLGPSKGIYKIDQQGSLTQWALKGAETFFTSITYGTPSGIYGARRVRGVFQILQNAEPSIYVSYAAGVGGATADTDFDQDLNMWLGANGSIISVTPSKVIKGFSFTGNNIIAIKIFNGAIFAISTTNNEQVLWKIPIINADSIGTPELYFNFTSIVDPTIKLVDLAIAADGDIYLGTDAVVDPIYIIHQDKSFEKLYPGVLTSSVTSLSWGNGNYLYMTRTVVFKPGSAEIAEPQTIYRIDMEKQGAPSYGR